jgi:exodeoxyribonuclease VII large subunit
MSEVGQLTNSETNPLTVLALNNRVKARLREWPNIWVEGELVKMKEYPSATYATLRDIDGKAAVDIVIWSSNYPKVDERFKDADRVIVEGRFDSNPSTGKLQFSVQYIKKVGLGDLYAQLEELRKKLRAEGVIDESKRKPLPFLPNRIGLITGRDSDAEKDVKQNVLLRWPDAKFEVEHVAVQGPGSPAQVIAAIKKLDANPEVDVIIIARGGGAFLELYGFSDEALVRAAAASVTPIISAIGHEADHPVLDDVADLRASTPTDAAKRVVPDVTEERQRIADALARIEMRVKGYVENQLELLSHLKSRPVLANPYTYLDEKQRDLSQAFNDIIGSIRATLDRELAEQGTRAGVLRSLSPQGTLDRGYSVVRDKDGHVIQDAKAVKAGTNLKIRLAHGEIEATSN